MIDYTPLDLTLLFVTAGALVWFFGVVIRDLIKNGGF